MTPSGIEPATFRFVAQHDLNKARINSLRREWNYRAVDKH